MCIDCFFLRLQEFTESYFKYFRRNVIMTECIKSRNLFTYININFCFFFSAEKTASTGEAKRHLTNQVITIFLRTFY